RSTKNALSVAVNAAKRMRGNGYICPLFLLVSPPTVDNQPKDTGRHQAPQSNKYVTFIEG
ncbi:hypothetical protein ACJ4I1_004615, partial [Escherichia coli]